MKIIKTKRFWDVILYTLLMSIVPGLITAWHYYKWDGLVWFILVWAALIFAVYETELVIRGSDQ